MAAAIQLPPLVQRIILDPTAMTKGAGAAVATNKKLAQSTMKTTGAMQSMGGSLNTLAFRAQTTGNIMMKRFGLPIVAVAGMAVAAMTKFEQSMVKIEALVGVSTGGVERFATAVRSISTDTGRAPQELAEAMFFVASAGLRGSTALEVLEASAKGAAIGLGQTKVVVDAATSAVNAYGAENLSGGAAVDVLTAAVREGKVEADRLAPAIGKAIPVASAMGVEFHEVAAAIAAMTRTGTDARTSAIQLRQIMQSILDPSRQTERALRELGIAQGELADQARERGLLSVLKRLRDLSEDNEQVFADVFPNVRALAGALDITGENLAENEQIFHALANSAGDTDKAFQRVQETASFKFQKAMAQLKEAFVELGMAIAPLVGMIVSVMGFVAKFFKTIGDNQAMAAFMIGLGGLFIVMGSVLKVTGMTVTAMNLWASTAVTVGGTATLAAKGVAVMSMAMKAIPLIAIAAGLVTMVTLFFKFGRSAESQGKKLGKFQGEIADIKVVAGEALTPLGDFTDAIDGLGKAVDRNAGKSDSVRAFNQAYEDIFDDMLATGGTDAQAVGMIEAFIRRFAGQADNPATYDAFVEIHKELGSQFVDGFDEFKQKIFGVTDVDEIFSLLLGADGSSVGTKAIVRAQGQMIANEFMDDVLGPIVEAQEIADRMAAQRAATANAAAGVAQGDLDDIELRTPGIISDNFSGFINDLEADDDLTDYLTNMAEEMLSDAANFMPREMFQVQDILLESIFASGDYNADQKQMIRNSIGGALAEAMRGADAATSDGLKDIEDSLDEGTKDLLDNAASLGILDATLVRSLGVSEGIFEDLDKMNERQMHTFTALGSTYLDVLQDIVTAQNFMAETGVQPGELSPFMAAFFGEEDPAQRTAIVVEEVLKTVEAMGEELGPDPSVERDWKDISEVFKDLETAIAQATAAGDEFQRRFDLLFGTRFSADEAFGEMQEGLQGMVTALVESGGAFDQFSQDGRKARDSIRSAIETGVEGIAAMVDTGQISESEAGEQFVSFMETVKGNLELAGLSAKEIETLFGQLGLDNLTGPLGTGFLLGAPGDTIINDQDVIQNLENMKTDAAGILSGLEGEGIGTAFMQGIEEGMDSALASTKDATRIAAEGILSTWKTIFGIESPSVVFAKEVGRPITAGIAKGMLDEQAKIRFTVKELVNSAMSSAKFTISSVSRAITAQLDFEDAQRAHDKAVRDFGEGGEITKREALTKKQLERRVEAAKRALRLGQGHQEDLELSLMDAQNALDDFDNQVTSEGPVLRANVALMDAGFEMAQAMAVMKMEGQKAIDLFTNLGQSVGIPMDRIDAMLAKASENEDIFRNIFDDEVIEAIERAADAWMIISSGSGGKKEEPFIPFAGGDSYDQWVGAMAGSVEMDTGVYGNLKNDPLLSRTGTAGSAYYHGATGYLGGSGLDIDDLLNNVLQVHIANPDDIQTFVNVTARDAEVKKWKKEIEKFERTGFGIF